MSGGEPSSIKELSSCDTVRLPSYSGLHDEHRMAVCSFLNGKPALPVIAIQEDIGTCIALYTANGVRVRLQM